MHRELLISLEDIETLTVQCSECGAAVTVPVNDRSIHMASCPLCRQEFGDGFKETLTRFAGAVSRMREMKHHFSFRIPEK